MRASTFVSEYIKAETLKQSGPRIFTVHGTEVVQLKVKDSDKVEKKLAVVVEDGQKLLLNKQNAQTLIELFGTDDTDTWTDRRFEAYFDPSVTFGGKKTGGLRVREDTAEVL
jgi:hypothetical protein